MDLNNSKYLEWLMKKYNPQESLCDVVVKDENGNPKWTKVMARKLIVKTNSDDYKEYCKLIRKEGDYGIRK